MAAGGRRQASDSPDTRRLRLYQDASPHSPSLAWFMNVCKSDDFIADVERQFECVCEQRNLGNSREPSGGGRSHLLLDKW